MTTAGYYATMADAQVAPMRELPFMGLRGDTAVASLRCFQRYSNASTTDVYAPDGRVRWVTRKQGAIYATLHRMASSGERVTMREIAGQVMCCPSTVSRAVLKFQAWGIFAIDVKRGRNGGMTVRLRRVGDALRHYAEAAWKRIRSAINVAFTFKEEVVSTPVATTPPKDATFSEGTEDPLQAVRHLHPNDPFRRAVVKQLTEARRIEHAGAMVSQGEWSIDYAQAWYDAEN